LKKKVLLEKAIANLQEEINSLEETSKNEHELMKEAPSAMQSHSDTTRSQKEALLLGYAKKIEKKQNSLAALKSLKIEHHEYVTVGSLVKIYEEEKTDYFFLIPGSSGSILEMDGKKITILSPKSVIAQKLFDCEEGEIIKVQVPKGMREFEIISIE
jgi:transcription elongation GreA/GreB family factor